MTSPSPSHRVLFVCVENANRSQMAEAFARLYGRGRVEAFSAGSRPAGRPNPRAVKCMAELGYDLGAHRPKAVSDLPAVAFDAVITMGCGDACPTIPAHRREDWPVPDPRDMDLPDLRRVRNEISARVQRLLASL